MAWLKSEDSTNSCRSSSCGCEPNGQQSASIEMRYGKLALNELALEQVEGAAADRAVVVVDGKEISAEFQIQEGRYVVRLPKGLGLKAGQKMEVRYV